MRYLLFLICCVLGCNGDSAQDAGFAKPVDEGGPVIQTVVVNGPKPPATTTAAAEVTRDLLIAHANGNPASLLAFRTGRVKRTGEMDQGGSLLPAECTDRFVWPDQYRGDWKLGPGITPTVFVNRDIVTFFAPNLGHEKPVTLSPSESQNNLEDIRATAMTMLLPLADPKDYVADIVPNAPADLKAVRIWARSDPPMVLLVDAKSKMLKKVLFEKAADGRPETWAFVLNDFKPVQGVLLPHKVSYSAGHRAGATWTGNVYETASSFPPGTFEKP